MVGHEAVSIGIGNGIDVLGILAEKVMIVLIATKQVLATVGVVVHVIDCFGKKRRRCGSHKFF
jgi:hypothetical protein